MSEVKKVATRVGYAEALVELGKEHEEVVVLDADLAAATQTKVFREQFPAAYRLWNCRGKHDRHRSRTFHLWKSTVYEFFCNVCSRPCLRAGA